jgi:putative protease
LPRPELLAPAGDWDCVQAAVENGADAVYFGLDRFNARMRAHNFTTADLPRLMSCLHRRGVRGYVTFNTLVFTGELAEAEVFLRAIMAAGVDAAIVQDVGLCRLIRQLSPDFPIHASTQMTVTNHAGLEFARELGCRRVVLARECSLKEIARLRSGPDGGGTVPRPTDVLPLEVFVHGALCVAYSGQCLTSEALGGRSANRGECAQACRLPYELVADGQTVPLGDRRYLLSPQDLAGLDVLPELVRLGVAALKIEGRLKSPEYVANITRLYREALDALWSEAPGPAAGTPPAPLADRAARPPLEGAQYEMEMAFSRGLSTGWFRGVNNQELVHARFPKKRGVLLGEVTRVVGDHVHVRLAGPLKPGDGVVFDAGRPDEPEEGGRVYEIHPAKSRAATTHLPPRGEQGLPEPAPEVVLGFGRGDLDFRRLRPGQKLWKTSDPELERRLRRTYVGDSIRFQRPVHLAVEGSLGQPLRVAARDELGHVAEAASEHPLERAATQPLTAARLRDQLGRLGGTPFRLGRLETRMEGSLILPVSDLNRIRRALVDQLEQQRAAPRGWRLHEPPRDPPCATPPPSSLSGSPGRAGLPPRASTPEVEGAAPSPPDPVVRASSLHLPPFMAAAQVRQEPAASPSGPAAALIVLVRNLAQLEAALTAGVTTLYCELEDPKRYREAVAMVHARRVPGASPTLFIAPPRISKPGEEWILQQVRSAGADGYLVRCHDHLTCFAGCRCVGDYSLNVANPLAAEYLRQRFGLERLTASYDLNGLQLEALLAAAPPAWFELTVHQHMPMFHMEHCVFCAFLSRGTDYTNCGRPCDRHDVRLRDRVGALHPVKADAGCRNTVFHAQAQTGAAYVPRLQALGARHFRLEFLDEPPAVVSRTIQCYRELLAGQRTAPQLGRELQLRHQLGVTRGALDPAERPLTVL